MIKKKVERSYDTPEARDFWEAIARDAAVVRTWPEWRKAGVTGNDQEPEEPTEGGRKEGER